MSNGSLGITFRETMTGPFALGETDPKAGEAAGKRANTELSMHASVEIRDLDRFVADEKHNGSITGQIDFAPFGKGIPAGRGVFRLFSPSDKTGLRLMVYELGFEHGVDAYYVAGQKQVQNDHSGTDCGTTRRPCTRSFTRAPTPRGRLLARAFSGSAFRISSSSPRRFACSTPRRPPITRGR
jgi:hypothetical protein